MGLSMMVLVATGGLLEWLGLVPPLHADGGGGGGGVRAWLL